MAYKQSNLVDRERIELSPSRCKRDVLPLSLTAQICIYDTIKNLKSKVVGQEGLEPST